MPSLRKRTQSTVLAEVLPHHSEDNTDSRAPFRMPIHNLRRRRRTMRRTIRPRKMPDMCITQKMVVLQNHRHTTAWSQSTHHNSQSSGTGKDTLDKINRIRVLGNYTKGDSPKCKGTDTSRSPEDEVSDKARNQLHGMDRCHIRIQRLVRSHQPHTKKI